MTFFTATWQLEIDIGTLTGFLCLYISNYIAAEDIAGPEVI